VKSFTQRLLYRPPHPHFYSRPRPCSTKKWCKKWLLRKKLCKQQSLLAPNVDQATTGYRLPRTKYRLPHIDYLVTRSWRRSWRWRGVEGTTKALAQTTLFATCERFSFHFSHFPHFPHMQQSLSLASVWGAA